MGEESEGNIGDSRFDIDDDHGSSGTAAFGDANAIIDAYSHKHDNAEDASFFDAETKKQSYYKRRKKQVVDFRSGN